MTTKGPIWGLWESLKAGKIDRREFLARSTALGMSAATAAFVVNSLGMKGAAAQDSTPVAATGRPTAGTENITRGQGGEVRILLWQAVTHLSPHTGNGTKDYLGASFVLEPLMSYMPDATVIPNLVTEVPTVENGGLAEDLSTVTYKLLPDVVWSDGEPFTARDVEFTWQWITDPANATVSLGTYEAISAVEVIDDLTVKLTFASPSLMWYVPFTGSFGGQVYPGHVWGFDPTNRDAINGFRSNPVGTGPYIVQSFAENDQVVYEANPNYREPNKPFFQTVNLKGGGDAASAARAVLQTGDYDYAWNMQVEPQILNDLAAAGNGQVVTVPGTSLERIMINFADPHTEIDGERAAPTSQHPVFTDKAVRQAMSMAIDRETIANQFYQAPEEKATSNVFVGIPAYESPNTSFVFDTAAANQILDDAGWVLDGNVRKKDGLELSFSYATSINPVRQKTQAVVKDNLAEIGVEVDLLSVDAGIFFDSAAGNDQTYTHFFWDLEMYTSSPGFSYPIDYAEAFYAGPDNSNFTQKANDWSGQNLLRFQNADYDAAFEEAQTTTDPERAAELFITMNDVVIAEYACIPLVHRATDKYAISNRLSNDNVALGPFESNFWNIQNWVTVEGQ